MRRVYKSTTALDAPPPATTLTARGSDILSKVDHLLPKRVLKHLSEQPQRTDREARDQRREESVLRQVLRGVLLEKPTDDCEHALHMSPRSVGAASRRARHAVA